MGRQSSATINYTLTAYAQGLMNDLMRVQEVVSALCPTVVVTGASGGFKKFDDRNTFTVYNTQRGLGGAARRIEFSATDGSFNCEPQALEVTVDDHERDLAVVGGGLNSELLDQGKVRALLNATALSHVDKIVTYVLANAAAVASRGNWSNEAIDPIDQLDEQLDALSTDVGSTSFINLVLSTAAWRALRNHPKVKARCSGVQVGGISREQLGGLLLFPVNVVIGAISKTSNKVGQSSVTKSNIIGGNALLTYAVPNPTQYDPSAFKCFTTGQGNIQSVRTYRDESARSDVHAVDWSEDLQVTSSLAVKRLAIT